MEVIAVSNTGVNYNARNIPWCDSGIRMDINQFHQTRVCEQLKQFDRFRFRVCRQIGGCQIERPFFFTRFDVADVDIKTVFVAAVRGHWPTTRETKVENSHSL